MGGMTAFICLLVFSIIHNTFFMSICEDTGNLIALFGSLISSAGLFLAGSVLLEGDWKWLP